LPFVTIHLSDEHFPRMLGAAQKAGNDLPAFLSAVVSAYAAGRPNEVEVKAPKLTGKERAILSAIRSRPGISRSELLAAVGCSMATIVNVIGRLQQLDAIKGDPGFTASKGRPALVYVPGPNADLLLDGSKPEPLRHVAPTVAEAFKPRPSAVQAPPSPYEGRDDSYPDEEEV
jgi:hypothetical protein